MALAKKVLGMAAFTVVSMYAVAFSLIALA